MRYSDVWHVIHFTVRIKRDREYNQSIDSQKRIQYNTIYVHRSDLYRCTNANAPNASEVAPFKYVGSKLQRENTKIAKERATKKKKRNFQLF